MKKKQDEVIKIPHNIYIVLVGTTHPGNIGAAARAMKTMSLQQLMLVAPKIYPSAEATARASGADDLLANIRIFDELSDALQDFNMIFATSARSRSIQWPTYSPTQAAQQIAEKAAQGKKCAIVFGRESSGLSNHELELCNAMIQIPSNPEFSSLNLASAVQIISYELQKQLLESPKGLMETRQETKIASSKQMQQFYEHLEQCLTDIGYYDPDKPRLLMRRLKRLYNRAQLDEEEYSILRGILAATQAICKKP